MSSHHIIRDEQEPALIIHKIGPDQYPTVQELLGWAPVVIASYDALAFMLDHGHKIDVAMVPPELLSDAEHLLEAQQPVQVLGCAEDQFVNASLLYLQERKHPAVNVITVNEMMLPLMTDFLISPLEIVVFTDQQKHVLCRSTHFKKWLPAFSQMALMPLVEHAFVSTSGFDMDLENELLAVGIELYKKMEGEVVINLSKAPALISESLF